MQRCLALPVLIFILLVVQVPPVQAQDPGYIEADSMYKEGGIRFNPKKPYQLQFLEKEGFPLEIIQASELTGFGWLKRKVNYGSFEIEFEGKRQHVFLRLLSDLRFDVYELSGYDRIFLKTDRLVELDKDQFREQLEEIIPPCSAGDLRLLPYNAEAINSVIRKYGNSGSCISPDKMRIGFFAGYTSAALSLGTNSEYTFGAGALESDYTGAGGGVFAHIPYWPVHGLYIIGQMSYQPYLFQGQAKGVTREVDLTMKMSTLQFSPGLLYEFPVKNMIPYVFGAPSFQYFFGTESEALILINSVEFVTYEQREEFVAESGAVFGLTWGAGLRLFRIGKTAVYAEYQGSLHNHPEDMKIQAHSFQCKIGF